MSKGPAAEIPLGQDGSFAQRPTWTLNIPCWTLDILFSAQPPRALSPYSPNPAEVEKLVVKKGRQLSPTGGLCFLPLTHRRDC